MKSFQLVVCFRLGAGGTPWRRRILPTVWSDSRWPRLAKAPYRSWIADGDSLLVFGFGTPDGNQFHFAGFGRPVLLLAGAPDQLGGAHGNARAIDAQIQGGRKGGIGHQFYGLPLIFGDFLAQGFGGTFDLLGVDLDSG